MQWHALIAAVCLAAATSVATAAGPTFSGKPAVAREGEKVRIRFAVSAATDVEVAILDSTGRVVRHLAAGVLGGKSPPPEPLRPGLAQDLVWDGKDDAGADRLGDSAKGPVKVRVRAGMGVKFGRMLGGSPYTGGLGQAGATAVAPDGSLYVKMGSFVPQLHEYMPWQLRKFDRSGAYQQTLLPYPAGAGPDKVPAFRLLDAGDPDKSGLTPASMTPLDPVLFYLGDSICPRTIDGCVVFLDSRAGRLNFVRTDGSNELQARAMRSRPDKLKWQQVTPQVAFTADGKVAYYSNLANIPYDPKKAADLPADFPQGRVYRHDLSRAGADPETFFDLQLPEWSPGKYWLPNAWNKRSAAAGIDVDSAGNVLVGDLVNQEVVEVGSDGRKLSATKVDWPDRLVVSRKTGALYVVSRKVSDGYPPAGELIKIVERGESARVAARLALPAPLGFTISLDESADPSVLWVGGNDRLIRVEDRDGRLEPAGELANRDKDAIGFVCYMDVDPEADLVYVTQGMGPVWRFDGQTGKGGLVPIRACDLAVGPGGMVYAWGDTGSYAGPVTRYGRDLKPAPLASTGKHTYGSLSGRYGRGNSVAGLDVDRGGRVYATNGGNSCQVQVYQADGTGPAAPALITGMTDMSGSIRVDLAGNVYVLQIGLPKGHAPPRGFEKDPAYLRCTGTIYKFPPSGGAFEKGQPVGSLASYPGCGPISGNWASTVSVCHCTKPRFDVDGFGRLYVPNAFTFKVAVVDNSGNEIVRFGGYGNLDSEGPDSPGKPGKPEIPLGWPIAAGASDRFIYVGDCLNHRVVRVDRTFAAEEICDLK